MIDVKVTANFDPDDLMRAAAEAASVQFAEKLKEAGVLDVKISVEKGEDGNWRFKLEGPDDQLQKATELITQD